MSLPAPVPTRRMARKICMLGLAAACAASHLLGSGPSACFQAVGAGAPGPELVRSGANDPFFKGPTFLKVLFEPTYMDFGDDDRVFKGMPAFAEETGTNIMMSKKGDWYPHRGKMKKVVSISGEEGKVLTALSQLIRRLPEAGIITFLVPKSVAGALIGPGGEEIKKIQEKTAARINIDQPPKLAECQVSVSGAKQALQEVAVWLLSAMANFKQDVRNVLTGPYQSSELSFDTEIYFQLTREQTARVIGRGGKNIKLLQKVCLARVYVDSEQNLVKLSGAIGDVHAAHTYIMRQLVTNPQQDPA